MFTKKTVKDIDVASKKVIVRTILNVPIEDNKVTDNIRLEADKPTLEYLLSQNAKIILISHHSDTSQSLACVAPELAKILDHEIKFVNESIGPEVEAAVAALKPGDILMLENLRFHPEEQDNEANFAKTLAGYGEVFVQDDFTNCHREHASMIGIPKYLPAVAGLSLAPEVDTIIKALEDPKRPLVAITAGAKISTKIPILSFLLDKVDAVFIGGAMANTFLLAQGKSVGKSLVEPDQVDLARQILKRAQQQDKTVLLPIDVVVASEIDPPKDVRTVGINEIGESDIIADLGPQTVAKLDSIIKPEGTVIWNGPVGIFETPEFASGTKAVADKIINSGAYSLIGGGDTLAFVDSANLHDNFSFASTGGGASLDLMSGKKLPGVEALQDK